MKLKKWVQNLLATNIVVSLIIIGGVVDSMLSLIYTILPIITIILSGTILYKWGDLDE